MTVEPCLPTPAFLPSQEQPSRAMAAPCSGKAWCAGWLLALLLGLTPTAMHAEPDTRAVLALRLNHSARQEIFPVLREGDVLVSLEDLESVQVNVHLLGGKREVIQGKPYVSLRSLAPEVSYVLDERNTHLELTIPPRLLPRSQVDLRSRAPAPVELARDASAFLNYAAHVKDTRLALTAEAAAGVGDVLLSSTAFWRSGSRPVRGLSQLTIDKPGPMLRTVLGDAQVHGGLVGGSATLGGIHFARNFELNPSFVQTPSFYLEGSAATPSSVEVAALPSR